MKTILLCVATSGYSAFWDFCLESHKEYCERHNIERRIISDELDGLNGKWTKLLAARELLRQGYTVLLVDADTQISPLAPHFLSAMIDDSKGVYLVRGISGRPNSGVIMLRGAPDRQAISLLDRCLELKDQPIDEDSIVTKEGENGHLIHVLKREPFSSYCLFLNRVWNCTIVAEAPDAHIRHFTNQLRENLEDGSWKPHNQLSIVASDRAEAILEAQWRLHRLTKERAIEHLGRNAAALDLLKRSVLDCSGLLEYPPLAQDNANGWLWRYEFATGLLETPTAALLRRLSTKDSVFLDAGAHIGYFSLVMASSSEPPNHILAVEAHPENFAILSRNLSGVSAECFHAALANSTGSIELIDGQGHSNSTIFPGNPTTGRTYFIKKTTVDEVMRKCGLQTLDLAKFDIEGAEILALEGAIETLAHSPNIFVVIESNPKLLKLGGFSPIDISRLMERFGLYGREIRDDFTLGPSGYIRSNGTLNMAFASKHRWTEIQALMHRTNQSIGNE